MIRVTSGSAKGRKLTLPYNTQKITAVKEVVKLAIFSIIGDQIAGATCLDLYAGSGNLGIEALSRGAKHCDFVDDSREAVNAIEANLRLCDLAGLATANRVNVLKFLDATQISYDIVFADPYYNELHTRHLLKLVVDRLTPNGKLFLLSSSTNTGVELPNEIITKVQLTTRKYGKTLLTIVTHKKGA